MKIIFFIIGLLLVTAATSHAYRMRENLNVLVPNNDVNVHANIKKLLSDDDFDPREVIEFLAIDRLLKPELEKQLVAPPSAQASAFILPDTDVEESVDNSIDGVTAAAIPVHTHTHKWKPTTERTTQGFNEIFEPEAVPIQNETTVGEILWTSTSPTANFGNSTLQPNVTTTMKNNSTLATTPLPYTTEGLNFTTSVHFYNSTIFSTTQQYNFTTTPIFYYNTTSSGGFNFTIATPTEVSPNWTVTTERFNPTTSDEFNQNSTTQLATSTAATVQTTTTEAEPNPTVKEECLLGKVNETLKWVNERGALQADYINGNQFMSHLRMADYSRWNFNESYPKIKGIEVLSLAFNKFDELPHKWLNQSTLNLQYLSLVGNYFQNLSMDDSLNLPNLQEIDLRKCGFKDIKPGLFRNMADLKRLYLSDNNIISLSDESFAIPTLEYLDLSSNREDDITPSPLRMTNNTFRALARLTFLDLSHTKLDSKSNAALASLPKDIIGISFCYTELAASDNFLGHLDKILYLDLSGNPQMTFTKVMFGNISRTLEQLEARDSSVESLEWTHPLIKLKTLNLKDNKLRNITNNSFSHMLVLEDLNLSKNFIVKWYTPLFGQNQQLKTLNLRENALNVITSEMAEDLLKVRHLALGRNQFECGCELYDFMHILFDATKNANLSEIEAGLDIHEPPPPTPTVVPVALGVRNVLKPEYDIMSRTYQRYYEQIERSIEALKRNNYSRKSKSFMSVMMASAYAERPTQTVLLDYDENNEDYRCMNVTEKALQSMLDLIEQCDTSSDGEPAFVQNYNGLIIALSASLPSVLCVSVLLFIIYWKWWYIRYFFVLCKNSAILSFMDDDGDSGAEAIVRRKSDSSIDIFLYDVFVSYSDQNRSWVLDEFIPNIERRESINVCLHERDFQVGYGILENIVSCMDRSRCLLLLISEKFLESQWCQFEMNLAQHRLLETRKEKLILVLLEDIPVRKQSKTLKYLMRTKTYIKWPGSGTNDERQLFWRRLKKSIISSKWEQYDNYGSTSNA